MIQLQVWQFVLIMLTCVFMGVIGAVAYIALTRWTQPEKYGASLRR